MTSITNPTQNDLKSLTILELVTLNFESLRLEDKICIRDACHPRPGIVPAGLKDKVIKSSKVYKDFPWICGSLEQNLYFCFPCLLYHNVSDNISDITYRMFAKVGLSHPHRFAAIHIKNQKHLKNSVQLAMLGKVRGFSLLRS